MLAKLGESPAKSALSAITRNSNFIKLRLRMYTYLHKSMNVCIYICMYVYMNVCMYVRMYVYMNVCTSTSHAVFFIIVTLYAY